MRASNEILTPNEKQKGQVSAASPCVPKCKGKCPVAIGDMGGQPVARERPPCAPMALFQVPGRKKFQNLNGSISPLLGSGASGFRFLIWTPCLNEKTQRRSANSQQGPNGSIRPADYCKLNRVFRIFAFTIAMVVGRWPRRGGQTRLYRKLIGGTQSNGTPLDLA